MRAYAGAVLGLLLATTVAAGPAPAHADAPTRTPATAPAPAAEREEGDDAPLKVSIEQLTPGALPRSGPLRVRGTLTNVDLETWRDINLYPVLSSTASCQVCAEVMTTAEELRVAADSDPEALVGERYTAVSDDVTTLAPGESVSYSLRIPQAALRALYPSPEQGVYWFGVHASGASESTPRDTVADGRARTFLPYVAPRNDDTVEAAVVLPLRAPVSHTGDGSLADTSAWEDALGLTGTLGGPLAFGAASGTADLTWLVDPAVPDAVRRLALGNLPREIVAVPPPPDPDASEDPSDSASPPSDEGADEPEAPVEETSLTRAADTWLLQAEAALPDDTVLGLPYGDPDVAALADHLPSLYATAREHSGTELSAWDVETVPTVGAPNGYLDPGAIDAIDDDALLLLGDQMFPAQAFPDPAPVGGLIGDRPVVVTSSAAAQGGPGPDPALAPVALRQRLLSEAAVRLLAGRGTEDPEPLVVVLPESVTAVDARVFWSGLDLDWLRLTDLDDLVENAASAHAGTGTPAEARQIDPDELAYPVAEERAETPPTVLGQANRLIRAARAFQQILGEEYLIGPELVGEALAATSYGLRGNGVIATRVSDTADWVLDQLGRVTIDAPSGVTLSGTSGSFSVSVRNALPYPVTVHVAASTDAGATVSVANPIRLAANSRASVPISADMSRTGVHNVTFRLTDTDGAPLGAEDTLPLRSGQVGAVIWIIMGTGAAILFLAIGIRLARRIRRSGRPDDTEHPDDTDDTDDTEVTA